MKALFDTHILIDYLNGIAAAKRELDLYESHAVSIVTWREVMIGGEPELADATRGFLNRFTSIPISEGIAGRAVELRRERRLKLPDAIILATSLETGLMLVTRNTKDFSAKLPGVRHPYRI
ncbi:MAG: type II toxin-antitoxin system VapC family toxin [Betaproteobacteria bacterium]